MVLPTVTSNSEKADGSASEAVPVTSPTFFQVKFSVNAPKFLFCSDPSWRSDVPTYQPHRHNKHTRLSRVLYPSINLQIYDAKYILCSALTLCWSTVQ